MLALILCVQIEVSLAERDGEWTFRIRGKERTARAQVFVLWEVGGELDEEPLGPRETIDIPGDLYALKRKPYSLTYRVRVGDEHVDLPGDPAKLQAEVRERGEELARDLEQIRGIFDELRAEFTRARDGFDAKAWARWLDPWLDRVQEIEARNEDRFAIWAVYIEMQGKLRIEGFCRRLPDLASECREVLGGADPERSRKKMTDFLGYFEEAETVLGIELPLDLNVIGPLLERHRKAADRRAAIEPLLELAGLLPRHRRHYRLLVELMQAYLAGDGGEHARRLEEFRKMVGLR